MKKRVFVTGAAGFIGFHLCKALAERGDAVVGFDNFNPYYSPDLKRARARELDAIGVPVIEGDICSRAHVESEIANHRTTHLVHLAAQAGVRYSLQNPDAYIQSNIQGFLNILEICRMRMDLPLIYASSSSVYGLNDKVPFSETDRTDRQASLYGNTKKSNELMAATYHHLFGFPVTGLRFFTVYGPWGRPDMAYYSFTQAILDGRPIDIYNEGKLERDFTYIDDIIAGTIAAVDRPQGMRIYNLGNNQPIPLMQFIETLEQCLGIEAKKRYLPMQQGDVYRTYADISLSQKELGFSPSTPIDQGLKNFVAWHQAHALQEDKK